MSLPAWVVVIGLAWVAYTYLGYPILCMVLAWLRPRPIARRGWRPRVTVVVAARNEAERIAAKLQTLAEQRYPADLVEVVIACDGAASDPTDATAQVARRAGAELMPGRVRVLELPSGGKASALNAAVATATGEILVMTDARQRLSSGAVRSLVEDLGDPTVGAVGGELILEGDASTSAYWRYEAWLRKNEGIAGSTVGVSGALYAMKRSLWRPLPPGTLLDDVLVPMRVRHAGLRVAFERDARAYDRAAETGREFRRKVRTLSGNFQLLALAPLLLAPWSRSWFSFASHKLARLMVPYALVAVLVASSLMSPPWSRALLAAQVICYGFAGLGLLGMVRFAPLRPFARLAETFVALNAAAVAGLVRFVARRRELPW